MLRMQLKARLSVARPFVASAKRLSSSYTPEPEYTSEPKYPAIFDPLPQAEERRQEEKWHDWLKSHSTVEEKLFEINMPKRYGWHSVMINETHAPYNLLPMAKFVTRTSMIEEETLTQIPGLQKINELADQLLPTVKGHVEDVIVFHNASKSVGDISSDQLLVNAINRILVANIAPSVPHLNDIEISHNPRMEAFWFVGGIDKAPIPELEFYFRQEFYKNHKPFTEDRAYQYTGKPILHVRSQLLLPEVSPREASITPDHNIEEFRYDPSTVYNFENKYRHGVTLPGFWPGDRYEFGLFSMHSRKHIDNRPSHYEVEEQIDAAHASAILASFSWVYGQACIQGFSTFHDVTYPLVTQTALTDGRRWSFYLYQLNTVLLHHEYSTENKYHNVCWGTKTQDLFNSIENGRVVGFNEDVLKQILKMYLVAPQARPGVNMKPYLDEKHLVHQIDFDERRAWLHEHFRHHMSNRPRKPVKEPTISEKIFLTYYPLDRVKKKVEWFQLGIDLRDTRMDEHALKYRPKELRTRFNIKRKSIQRYYRNYYPGTNKEYDPDDLNS